MSDHLHPPRLLAIAAIAGGVTVAACSGDGGTGPTTPVIRSRLDGTPLDAARLGQLRAIGEGCLFVVPGATGEQHVLQVTRRALPFRIPALAPSARRAPGDAAPGRIAKLLMPVEGSKALRLQLQCIVPSAFTLGELLTAIDASRASPRWRVVWSRLLSSAPIPVGRPPAVSAEAREVLWEMVGAASGARRPSGLSLSLSGGGCDAGATCLATVTITAPAPGAAGSTSTSGGTASGNPELPESYFLSPHETLLIANDEEPGGSNSSPPPRDSTPVEAALRCDPRVEGCEDTLTARERGLLDSLLRFARDTNQLSDSLRNACAAMQREFAQLLRGGHVFRGNSSVSDSTTGSHGAVYYDGRMHVDGKWLDRALNDATTDHIYRKLVTSMVLHEAAHALGFEHRSGYGPGDFITEYPFRYTNYYDPSSCVAY